MRQHSLHNHCYHPAGNPSPVDQKTSAPALDALPVSPDFDSEDATDVPFTRLDSNGGPAASLSGGGSGCSFVRPSSPFIRSDFLPAFRRPESSAQDFSDSNMGRYSKPSPKKEASKKSPKFLLQEEEALESSELAYEYVAQRVQLASQESLAQEREEQPREEEPAILLDPVLASFLEAVPFPHKSILAQRLGKVPTYLVERCLTAGARARLVGSGEAAGGVSYCTQSRRLSYRDADLESDFAVLRTLAQAVDHTVGGDGLASRRALAVLAALPGPGWKPEDFFSQELARYLLGQRAGPLESYLTYLLSPPLRAEGPYVAPPGFPAPLISGGPNCAPAFSAA